MKLMTPRGSRAPGASIKAAESGTPGPGESPDTGSLEARGWSGASSQVLLLPPQNLPCHATASFRVGGSPAEPLPKLDAILCPERLPEGPGQKLPDGRSDWATRL